MRKLILGFVALLLLFAACGDPDTDEAADTTPPATDPPAVQECEEWTPESPPAEDGPGESKPDIEIPDAAPPCDLVIQDIYEGTGDEAGEGAVVTVHYVGVAWSTGEQFDASWDRGETITFPLQGVIEGWQEGIPGMREGGRRQLIIPPDLAYGPAGTPGIAPNETLVFIVDLVAVEAA